MKAHPFVLFSMCMVAAPVVGTLKAEDWPQFRGSHGGASAGEAPVTWSETENLLWKAELPGMGMSSPIVVGDRVFVTCWNGYGLDPRDVGDQENLVRHLACFERADGRLAWSKGVAAALPEDRYGGMLTQHGYASHTPVSDGERVYAFFGKSGVVAFDMEGEQLWQRSVGEWTDRRGWGSAASPILYKNIVIVNAAIESGALFGLDAKTGEVVWREEASSLYSIWSTPALVKVDAERTDLVVPVPYEVWGLNPETGKLRWYVTGVESDSQCSTPVVEGDTVYLIAGRGAGAIAIRAGGKGDVTESHVRWRSGSGGRIASPVLHGGRMYWVHDGIANCIALDTGEEVYRARVNFEAAAEARAPRPVLVAANASAAEDDALIAQQEQPEPQENRPPQGPDRGRGGFGGGFGGPGPGGFGGGGRMGGQDYASPVAAAGKMYFFKRDGSCAVIELADEYRQLGVNRLGAEGEIFNATPAIVDGDIFVRSTTHLYRIGTGKKNSDR